MRQILELFDSLIKDSNVKLKSFTYLDGVYVFKINKITKNKDIIHTTIVINDGNISYETSVLTKHPIIWKRNNVSRKMIRKFKGKYVIYSVEYFNLLTLFLFHEIFKAYAYSKRIDIFEEIKRVMEEYKTIPLRGVK